MGRPLSIVGIQRVMTSRRAALAVLAVAAVGCTSSSQVAATHARAAIPPLPQEHTPGQVIYRLSGHGDGVVNFNARTKEKITYQIVCDGKGSLIAHLNGTNSLPNCAEEPIETVTLAAYKGGQHFDVDAPANVAWALRVIRPTTDDPTST